VGYQAVAIVKDIPGRRRFSDPTVLHAGRITLALRGRQKDQGAFPFLYSIARQPRDVSSSAAVLIAALVAVALGWLVAALIW
jgi:hypothetical protein